ncbi:Exportin-T-like protein [Leptotrombidium deliense]|uniref:Exportin-T n=1 Tax=Leptotrombidium deliense TaxID=299467 RepID=A0A443SIW9_9ACAR|nr:Exportin-T-like protein [Leptotrombidium deliense]
MNLSLVSNYLTSSDPSLQKETEIFVTQAFNYFETLRSDVNGWKICVETLLNCGQQLSESAVFFCLHVIENYLKTNYELDDESNRNVFRQFVFSWFSVNEVNSIYILNKFAYIVNTLFLFDFPSQRWNTFFQDFLAVCQNQRNCDLFLRILLQINADVADREIPRTPKKTYEHSENERNNLIKDKMRETCLLDVAHFWFNVIVSSKYNETTYRDSSPPLVCLCLNVIGAYVAWIDISLVTNESVMSDLFKLFEKIEYRCAVCECFTNILHKGMDPQSKAQLIEQFMAVDSVKAKFISVSNNSDCEDEEEREFTVKLSRLFNTAGLELVECYKKVKPKQSIEESPNSLLSFIHNAIECKFNILCQLLSHKNHIASFQVHSFAREFIQWLKNTKPDKVCVEDAKTQEFVVIISKSKFPLDYDFNVEEESEFEECRKSSKILFENLMCLNSMTCFNFLCYNVIEEIFRDWRSGKYTFADIEVALYFLYLLGENMNVIPDQKRCENLLQVMITSSISSYPHQCVHLMYFDIILRYEKFISHSLNFLVPQILISFLDERGFKNSSLKVRSRVSQVFNKFVKSHIKSKGSDKLHGFAEDIMKRLQDFLKLDITEEPSEGMTNGNVKPVNIFDDVHYYIRDEDQLLIYETVSVLIVCNHNFDIPKKGFLMRNLLFEPIWEKFESVFAKVSSLVATNDLSNCDNKINEERSVQIRNYCKSLSHYISLIARTSKGFSNVQTVKSINAQIIYLESFNRFVKCLTLNVNEDSLFAMQSAIRQLLHRLIVCLDETDILPLLPVAIENIFLTRLSFNAKNIQELVPLINQIVSKFKHSWMFQRDLMPFLKQMFLPLISSIFNLTADLNLGNDERQALHKSYYSFLCVLASNNILEVFTSLGKFNVLEKVLMSVVQGAVEFPDVTTQKSCFLVLKKIIDLQDSAPQLKSENGSSFKENQFLVEFMYKTVIPACFYAQLRQQDENQMTNECINCLRSIQQIRGNEEFCSYIQLQLLPQHFPNFSRSADLLHALVNNDNKLLKNTFKTFIQQFKKHELI